MEAILDANFIISCVRRKIDFLSELEKSGFKVLIPKEILQEMKDLRMKVNHNDRIAIDPAFQILNQAKTKKTKLGAGKIDNKLIELGKKGAYIATLDAYIKRNIPNKILIDDAKNSIRVERL